MSIYLAPIKTKLNSQFGEAKERLDRYRHEVRHFLKASDGEFTPINRTILHGFRHSFGLEDHEAEAIEQAEQAPYETKRQNLNQYESVLQATLQQENPLSEETRDQMRRLQKAFGLSDDEVQAIEAKLQRIIEQQVQERTDIRSEAKTKRARRRSRE